MRVAQKSTPRRNHVTKTLIKVTLVKQGFGQREHIYRLTFFLVVALTVEVTKALQYKSLNLLVILGTFVFSWHPNCHLDICTLKSTNLLSDDKITAAIDDP